MNNKIVLFFLTFLSLCSVDAMEPTDSDLEYRVQLELIAGCEECNGSLPWRVNYRSFEKKVKKFSQEGANFNVGTLIPGLTPLIRAAEQHDVKRCEILLKYGADINACTYRFTVLSAAASSQFATIDPAVILKLLVARGADINKPSGNGDTAIILGAGNPKTTKILLELGANPLIGDYNGNNALFHCLTSREKYTEYRKQVSTSLEILDFLVRQKQVMVSPPAFFTFLCCLKRNLVNGSQRERAIASAMYLNRKKIWNVFAQSLPSLSEALNFVNNEGQTVYQYYNLRLRKFTAFCDLYDPEFFNPAKIDQTEQIILKRIRDERELARQERPKMHEIKRHGCTLQ